MQKTQVPVKAYGGNLIEARKLAVFAEKDQKGEVFTKIEVQDSRANCVAVSFHYNLQEAIDSFTELMKDVMEKQIEKLQEDVSEDED